MTRSGSPARRARRLLVPGRRLLVRARRLLVPARRLLVPARRLLAGLVVAMAFGAAIVGVTACGPSAGGAANGSPVATANVDLPPSYKFVPPAIAVVAGTTVTWTNHDNFSHNVTLADGTPAMPMSPGQSVTHTFTTPGVYAYVCTLHPKDMKGSVTVTGG